MTTITSITVDGKDGLKGWVGHIDLDPVTVFAAPNGGRKTTHLLAVLALARGLADTETDDSRPYMGPDRPRAIVAGSLDDGTELSRDLSKSNRTGEGKAADAIAAKVLGTAQTRWDLADFANGGEKGRRELLDGLVRAGGWLDGWTGESTTAWLRHRDRLNLTAKKASSHALGQLLTKHPVSGADDVGAWVEQALAWTRDAYTKRNRAQKDATARAEHPPKPPEGLTGTLPEAEAEVERLEQECARLKAQLDDHEQAIQRVRSHEAAGQSLVQAVADAQAEVERAKAWLANARKAVSMWADQAAELEQRTAGLQKDLAEAEERSKAAAGPLEQARERRAAAVARMGAADSAIQTLEGMAGQDRTCKHCGCTDPLGIGADLQAAREEAEKAAGELAGAETGLRIATFRHKTAETKRVEAGAALDRCVREASSVESSHAAAGGHVASFERDLARAAEAVAAREQALQAHQEQPAPSGAVGTVDQVTAQLDAARTGLGQARARRDAHLRAQQAEASYQEAVAEREAAVTAFEEVKALGKALKDLQEELSKAAHGPVEDATAPILERVGMRLKIRGPADFGAYVERESGAYVPYWSLCDSDRMLVGAACAAAFSALSGQPWRPVIIDGLEALDPERMVQLVAACSEMVDAGDLSQFVGAVRADSLASLPEGLTGAVRWIGGGAV